MDKYLYWGFLSLLTPPKYEQDEQYWTVSNSLLDGKVKPHLLQTLSVINVLIAF